MFALRVYDAKYLDYLQIQFHRVPLNGDTCFLRVVAR